MPSSNLGPVPPRLPDMSHGVLGQYGAEEGKREPSPWSLAPRRKGSREGDKQITPILCWDLPKGRAVAAQIQGPLFCHREDIRTWISTHTSPSSFIAFLSPPKPFETFRLEPVTFLANL